MKEMLVRPEEGFGAADNSSRLDGGELGTSATPQTMLLSSTETVLAVWFATARSGLPSPFKSPIATPNGTSPGTKSPFVPKAPPPLPTTAETLTEYKSA